MQNQIQIDWADTQKMKHEMAAEQDRRSALTGCVIHDPWAPGFPGQPFNAPMNPWSNPFPGPAYPGNGGGVWPSHPGAPIVDPVSIDPKTIELIRRQMGSAPTAIREQKKKELQEQGRQAAGEWAQGVEQARSGAGLRGWLRKALASGSKAAMLRVWAAIEERADQAMALEAGKSETLMSAALGASPAEAIQFLDEKGFRPGRKNATAALGAMLALAKEQGCADEVEGLVEMLDRFGAAASGESLQRLQSALRARPDAARWIGAAKAAAEALELEACAPESGPSAPKSQAKRV